ncbi:MAG: hypothetical protein ACRBCJ_14995 [Hyphomicrobiaceae bacterium]
MFAQGGLLASEQFISAIGGLFPIALCGRTERVGRDRKRMIYIERTEDFETQNGGEDFPTEQSDESG